MQRESETCLLTHNNLVTKPRSHSEKTPHSSPHQNLSFCSRQITPIQNPSAVFATITVEGGENVQEIEEIRTFAITATSEIREINGIS